MIPPIEYMAATHKQLVFAFSVMPLSVIPTANPFSVMSPTHNPTSKSAHSVDHMSVRCWRHMCIPPFPFCSQGMLVPMRGSSFCLLLKCEIVMGMPHLTFVLLLTGSAFQAEYHGHEVWWVLVDGRYYGVVFQFSCVG